VRPPIDPNAPSDGFDSAVEHLSFALSDTVACLNLSERRAQLLEADSISIQFRERDFTFAVSPDSGVGAALLSTDKPPQEVPAPAGASSLIFLLPNAAAAYFNAPACKRDF